MVNIIWIGLFLPLIGFLIMLALAPILSRRATGIIACGSILLSFLSFVTLLVQYYSVDMPLQTFTLYNWIPIDKIQAGITLHLDALSLLMTLIITGVGFLIHVYSVGYMDHEEDYVRFFACLNFFVFAMLLLVLAGHLLLLFVGWEGVGLASYLLIGFWYQRPAAAKAATKAFVINRIGDLGFLLGLLLTFHTFGTGDISEISHRLDVANYSSVLPIIALLFFIGATGKSAQLPLHTWLPDAMEGPTPVSALIHAATMVTAGVYLVVRLFPLYNLTPDVLTLIGIVGAVTSLFAALSALGQTDLKRVLAYSTVSQLGLMFLACGVGAYYAAMFHLTMHAFMKALLFLSAGNVVHMMHGNTEMENMGGLKAIFVKTRWLFLVGVLAMSGIPPLAAFFSKDMILEQGHLAGYNVLFYIGLTTSILTAFYLSRAYYLTFTGKLPAEQHLHDVHEAPNVMVGPVSILAFLSIVGGFLGYAFGNTPWLQSFLATIGVVNAYPTESLFTAQTWMSLIGALLGLGAAYVIYTRFRDNLHKAPPLLLTKSFYVDKIYWDVIAAPVKFLAKSIAHFFEPKIFEGSIRGLVFATQNTARVLQEVQSGQIRSYIAWMVLGSVVLLVYLVLRW